MFSELLREITDLTPWKESIDAYISNLSINSVIVTVMMIFMLLGAIDKARGNKRGYGAAFDEGFQAMGPLAIAMVGVIAAAPVLSMVLRPIVGPIYQMLGSSPSIFATTLLLADAGGYPLAVELAGENIVMGQFAGIIVGCTMGCILLFDIPVALTLIQKKDRPLLACGILVGVITAPIGCFVGGIVGGHCGNTGQQHPDLSDDEGYEPQGKAYERCVCFLCGVYVRRPFGFCRRCQRRYDCSNDFCQAGMRSQCIGFGKFARTTAAFQSAKGGRK